MSIHNKSLIIVLIALGAAGFSCSQKDQPTVEMDAAEMDKAVESATESVRKVGSDAMDEAADLGDEVMNAGSVAMDRAEGEVAEIVDEAEDMANKAVENVEGMSEEELKKKAKKKLGLSD